MTDYIRPTPVFCAAAGMAVGFYLLSIIKNIFISIAVLVIALIVLCFFKALASFSGYFTNDKRREKVLLICCTVFAAGLIFGLGASNAGHKEAQFSILPETVIAIEGVLLEDPRLISGGSAMASVSLRRCAADTESGTLHAGSKGEITVFFPQDSAVRLREFGRGTTVYTEGSLRKPSQSGASWTFSAKSIHITKTAPAIERMRTDIRLNLIDRFSLSAYADTDAYADDEWGGLALALLLGIKDNLDSNLSVMYRKAGCSYILALSGMHLAILAGLIAFMLRKPLGLKAAAIIGAVIIILYCLLVGPLPSLYRAALMYLLGVVAILGFLPKNLLYILCLSFIIQIMVTPAAGHSISFILSYLALFGILLIGTPLRSLFTGKIPDFLLQPLSASCGAFFATTGVTAYSFKYIVPVGIIAGLILVPLTTVFMIGSLIWLFLDFFSISFILNFPLSLLYKIMEKIVFVAGGIGQVSTEKQPFTFFALFFVLSLSIVIFELKYAKVRTKMEPFK